MSDSQALPPGFILDPAPAPAKGLPMAPAHPTVDSSLPDGFELDPPSGATGTISAISPKEMADAEAQGNQGREDRIRTMGSSTTPTGPLGNLFRSFASRYSGSLAGLASIPGHALSSLGHAISEGDPSDIVGGSLMKAGKAITPDSAHGRGPHVERSTA